MAFDQTTRNRLARFVSDTRALITEEFTRQLQNEYGLDPASGEVTPIERLTALDDRRRETAHILRETLDYYLAGNPKADAKAYQDVLDRIVREQAFTVLNRLCALRMSEARGLVLESIAKGYQSKGFQLYARLAGSALGETGETYRMYLFSLMDEFAVDLPVLFDRFSPQGRLFPREAVLLKLLELINDAEVDSLWTEDETIGWIYQYFNSKEERRAMRDASQAPRNSRELAVRNQFFTPRYVVEFLTDNTLGRIWYEMTRGETVLKDSCRYLVRRKHSFFLEEGQEDPEPFLPEQRHETDPDLAHEMWLPPNEEITDLNTIFLYGLTAGGYDYAREQWGIECGDLANEKLKQYRESGKWEGTFDELRCCLFFEQRRYHHFGEVPEDDDAKAILDLYQAICERWNLEVEYIPHRPLKDPREIKMLDPACGSMHFGLYAFDLFEQIYVEAWELEERLGEDALKRLADLDSLHKTYPDQGSYLKDVPRLIIERNIHGVDIDPRAVQIAGLSLWLRAQKNWQTQGVRPGERPQIRKSNVVCAEPMPGDLTMLEEFLGALRGEGLEALMRKAWRVPANQKVKATPQMAEALAKLVRTVWNEMELAGEAGSLLKIEETLRDAIATARKEAAEKSPLFRVLEYGLGETPKEQYLQVVAGEEQDFFDRAEGLVLAALYKYGEQAENGQSYRRRLFAGDATQGFSFIDLCRKKYDVLLMNPPFGQVSQFAQNYCDMHYSFNTDIYTMFLERGMGFNSDGGFEGAITSRTYLHLPTFQLFRKKILEDSNINFNLLVEMGIGVLDDATVRAALCVFKNSPSYGNVISFGLRDSKNFQQDLYHQIEELKAGISKSTWAQHEKFFSLLPGHIFSYWIPPKIAKLFSSLVPLGDEAPGSTNMAVGNVRVGLTTGDDYRFIRHWVETPVKDIKNGNWQRLIKGGEYRPYENPSFLLLDWRNEGSHLKAFDGSYFRNEKSYGRSGVICPYISDKGIGAQPCPSNHIFSHASRFIQLKNEDKQQYYALLALLNSNTYNSILACLTADRKHESGILASLPIPFLDKCIECGLSREGEKIVTNLSFIQSLDETSPRFVGIVFSGDVSIIDLKRTIKTKFEQVISDVQESLSVIDEEIADILDLTHDELSQFITLAEHFRQTETSDIIGLSGSIDGNNSIASSKAVAKILTNDLPLILLSYLFGCVLGRWNIKNAITDDVTRKVLDPLESPPLCPPGMLQNARGLPAVSYDTPADYPLRISWSGILVDDEGHSEDIEGRVRDALHIIWGERVEAIEDEACQILGVHNIREYFRKPALFFADHLKRYSKSRRAAPIYWPLSTPSGSYTLWLYYHRLNDQTLYSCVNDFVDPKLKQVSEEAARLRLKKGRNTADEKELERLTDFERELKDFREELLRVAKFWKPNLNDGVEITAAPLWKLFQHKPWQKRLKETWQKLEAGEYDWAHLAFSIWPERVRQKCKTDKSLAIAHDLEELYLQPPASAKKKKAKKTAVDEETEGWFNDD